MKIHEQKSDQIIKKKKKIFNAKTHIFVNFPFFLQHTARNRLVVHQMYSNSRLYLFPYCGIEWLSLF